MHLITAVVLSGLLAAAPKAEPKSEPKAGHGHALDTLSLASLSKGALLFKDLGTHRRAVKTVSPDAQAFFDQGLRLLYGFNHDEAARSFARAAELDATCALCFWGAAYALGPNYNVPMLPGRAQAAWDALTKAQALAKDAPPVEQALIGALGRRYKGPAPIDPPAQQPFNEAFAQAMRKVAQQFPDDADVQVLFAESLMDVNPWKLWTLDGKAAPGTDEIVTAIEKVLAAHPEHPGANHYYIHAIEASRHPERAEPSADRLGKLIPGAGHVVHMPAHIYQRVGRYEDATETNRKAVAVDLAYMQKTDPPGYYAMYLGHNHGFLAYSASMEGRSQDALEASRKAAEALPPEMLETMPGMDFFAAEPLLAMVRFGKWDALLAEPRPDAKYPVLQTLWLHGQGMAHASLGQLKEARADIAALKKVRAKLPKDLLAGLNNARSLADVAIVTVEARIAEKEGKRAQAQKLWRDAVAKEDKLAYAEPADWFYPLRHYLGAALLEDGKAPEAERVYREDLEKNPKNGWALFGLWQALMAQGKPEASEAEKNFQKAWRRADITLVRTAL